MSHNNRVVVLVDMDCFYCQVEEKLNPALRGNPMAVVQYNAWQGGGIIAVNYQARDRGVTRHMRGNEAKKHCPEIELVRVPNIRGKADLTKYREAGKTVANVLQKFSTLLERASVDEAYMDITELVKQRMESRTQDITLSQLKNSFVVGCDTMDFLYNLYNADLPSESNLRLAYGGVIAEEIRAAVFEETGYTCSAGISHNKILAKLVCGLNKPNKQTLLPCDSVPGLFDDLPVRKIRSLGGKFGSSLSEDLGITNMGELIKFSMKDLSKRYDDKTALWLYNIARGIDLEPVTTRLVAKSIGCCKKFPGRNALITAESVTHWLHELALEVNERLEKDCEEYNRKAKQLIVSYTQDVNGKEVASSRTCPLHSYNAERITNDAFEVIKKNCSKPGGGYCIKFLGVNISKFEDCKNVNAITSYFKTGSSRTANEQVLKKEKSLNERFGSINVSNSVDQLEAGSRSIINGSNSLSELDESCSNHSPVTNFLDETFELDENISEMKFYEEDDNSDNDSISNELCEESMIEHKKNSFFLNYFQKLKEPETVTSRDFNTSLNLEQSTDDESNVESVAGPSHDTYQESMEVCDECHTNIPKSDFLSHKDFHFATNLVREETEIAKKNIPVNKVRKTSPVKEQKKNRKRKLVVSEKTPTLEKFFKNEENLGVNTELCSQCNKKVNVEDFTSHLDYHVAKKLHLEINPVVNSKKDQIRTPKSTKTTKNAQSVTSFFKPLG